MNGITSKNRGMDEFNALKEGRLLAGRNDGMEEINIRVGTFTRWLAIPFSFGASRRGHPFRADCPMTRLGAELHSRTSGFGNTIFACWTVVANNS